MITLLHARGAAAIVAAATLLVATTADARCTRLGFSVNDYGKDGPTRDAKALLDKHIADWAAKNGIKKYSVGKKDVKCELYLDLILFDEHTCRAEASVCWDGPAVTGPTEAGVPPAKAAPAKAVPAKAAPAKASAKSGETADVAPKLPPAPKAKPASKE